MDPRILAALGRSQVIDFTTTGRKSGKPRRIEIFLHNLGGRLVISGLPSQERTRAWLRNVAANPAVTLHLKGGPRGGCAGDGPRRQRSCGAPAAARGCRPQLEAHGPRRDAGAQPADRALRSGLPGVGARGLRDRADRRSFPSARGA